MTAPTDLSPLTTVPGVELARTGSWAISSGSWTPTREDFHAAVAAMRCPAVRPPLIKLGHIDPRFDGQPAVGAIENLRIEHGGHSLVGDLGGIPTWLANRNAAGHSVLSSAFPSRSVEGMYGYRCQVGHTHPFVLTGLALLGVTPPGVGTLRSLRDVADLYGVAAEVEPADGATAVSAVFKAAADIHTGAMVALIPTAEHAARLTVDGGEATGQLHLTLAYLGDAADVDETTRRATITALAAAFTGAGTVDADGFAISVFNPTNDERDTAIVLGVGGTEVDDAQSLAVQTLADVPGLVVPEQHLPFAGHVTLTYSDDLTQVAALADRTGPVVFDRLRVAFGGECTDIPLTSTIVEARFDPAQRRDGDGQWTGTGGGMRDKLKLAAKIRLGPGEYLTGSDRVAGDSGEARIAVVGSEDGPPTVRLGLGGAGFGSRHDDGGPWTGDPDNTETLNAERRALSTERDQLDAELHGADPDRAAAIEARIDQIDNLETNEITPSGYTAALPPESVADLRAALTEALAEGARLQAAFDADPDHDPDRPEQGYWTLAEGSVPGDWADVHYLAYFDDPNVGVEIHLGAVPHGSGLTLDDLTGSDMAASLDPATTGRLLRALGGTPVHAGAAEDDDPGAATTGRTRMPTANAHDVRAAWNATAPHEQWVTEIAPDLSYVVVVADPQRTFTRHQVHVSAAGQITFGRGRPIRLGYVDASGAVTAQRVVFASRDESRPAESTPDPAPLEAPTNLPAAEPEPTTEPKEGDHMSTLSTDVRSRLGLPEDATDEATLAAFDALKTKADAPAPDTQQVAASAAAVEKAEAAQQIMKEELARLSGELNAIKASSAATVKASFFTGLQTSGRLKPADRETWEARYDRDPEMVTEILSMRGEGTEVPVTASGETGAPEPTGGSFNDAEYNRLFGEKASA